QVVENGIITFETAKKGLDLLEIDELGLDNLDRKILLTIIENFSGGPVGIDTLAAATGEEKTTIEDVYEPYLIQIGFINRTPRGRVATKKAYKHFNLKYEE
ncbi:Holliday junction branch migration DNA helicase RuvB, partial [Vibrio parahaemolyticus]|nr:Holliday junction branch migration DNA helicase RuvB [Vibrio parahaemolyticus]